MDGPLADVDALVRCAAARLDRVELVDGITSKIIRENPVLEAEESLDALLRESVDGNIAALISMLLNGTPIESVQPSTGAIDYALRLAQRGVPGNALVRAYALGKDYLVSSAILAVQGLDCSAEEMFGALERMSALVGQYIDWISQFIFGVYELERERWISAEGNVRATLVHDLLRNGARPREFEAGTGYRLARRHLALVVWATSDDPSPDEQRLLNRVIARAASTLGCADDPLVSAVDVATAWAWLPLKTQGGEPELSRLTKAVVDEGGCRVAVGLTGTGVEGFRRSHEQALAARKVASSVDVSVMGYGDEGVAATAMLSADLHETSAWIAAVLGPLARDSDQAAVLRETLRVFHASGESYTATAKLMNMHRNTVRYRISRAQELLGATGSPARTDLAMALTVSRYLGTAVLQAE